MYSSTSSSHLPSAEILLPESSTLTSSIPAVLNSTETAQQSTNNNQETSTTTPITTNSAAAAPPPTATTNAINKKKKYIFNNGVMILNPEYQSENSTSLPSQTHTTSTSTSRASSSASSSASHRKPHSRPGAGGKVAPTVLPLAILSSPQDLQQAKQEKYAEEENPMNGPPPSALPKLPIPMNISPHSVFPTPNSGAKNDIGDGQINFSLGTLQAMDTIQHSEYQTRMTRLKETSLLDGLMEHFVIYEVPIGLISKLILLQEYHLHFMIDDSGSMGAKTDVTYRQATTFVRKTHPPDEYMTRIEEAEDRLHIMIDILSYLPVKSLTVSFMNLQRKLSFTHENKTPTTFQIDAHAEIMNAFIEFRGGGTPTLATLTKSFTAASQRPEPTLHYLFTDGVPSDCTIEYLSNFISKRLRPDRNPITLISCTNNDADCGWMKEIEERAKYCSELDDYNDEKEEVTSDQGPAFPYTRGLWLVSHLIAAICPHDLDAIDESIPFTKHTLDELMGRVHSKNEYAYYWKHHPKHKDYSKYYRKFLSEDLHAKEIISKTPFCVVM